MNYLTYYSLRIKTHLQMAINVRVVTVQGRASSGLSETLLAPVLTYLNC